MVAAVLALVAAGCGESGDSGGPTGGGGLTSFDGPDPGVAHVHGLGVDPADGTLYAATHYGLFRIPSSGAAARVANRYQDTMGFTVVGPRHFLGSGHPDHREDRPPLLGLIESTDAAQSWRSVSLSGEADFHALHATGDQVYGWNASAGDFMASGDGGKTWDRRARLSLRDFAVNPADPQIVLATVQNGLARSSDGGRTFQPTQGAVLAVLAWPQPASLLGLTPEGQVQHSADGGTTWTMRGTVGAEPEAFTADGDTLYAAVADRGILASTDGGRTWTVRYRDPD